MRAKSGLICFMTRKCNTLMAFEFHEELEISVPDRRLLASQEELCFLESISHYEYIIYLHG
jgi:hypothetical protein